MARKITQLRIQPTAERGVYEIRFMGKETLEGIGEMEAHGLLYMLHKLEQGFFLTNAATHAPVYFARSGGAVHRKLKELHGDVTLIVI